MEWPFRVDASQNDPDHPGDVLFTLRDLAGLRRARIHFGPQDVTRRLRDLLEAGDPNVSLVEQEDETILRVDLRPSGWRAGGGSGSACRGATGRVARTSRTASCTSHSEPRSPVLCRQDAAEDIVPKQFSRQAAPARPTKPANTGWPGPPARRYLGRFSLPWPGEVQENEA
jgi:hypothetical protein